MSKCINFIKRHTKKLIIAAAAITATLAVVITGSVIKNNLADSSDSASSMTGGASQSYFMSLMTGDAYTENSITYSTPGVYSAQYYDTADITSKDVVLETSSFEKLTITPEVGDGTIHLSDSSSDYLVIAGGGQDSVYIEGGNYDYVISTDTDCHIVIGENTVIGRLTALSSSNIDVHGSIAEAIILDTTYTGEIDWLYGFNTYEGATVTSLSVSETTLNYPVSAEADTISQTGSFRSDRPFELSADAGNIVFASKTGSAEAESNQNTTAGNASSNTNRTTANTNNTNSNNAENTNNNTSSSEQSAASNAWWLNNASTATAPADTAASTSSESTGSSSSSGSSGRSSSSSSSSSSASSTPSQPSSGSVTTDTSASTGGDGTDVSTGDTSAVIPAAGGDATPADTTGDTGSDTPTDTSTGDNTGDPAPSGGESQTPADTPSSGDGGGETDAPAGE